MSDFIFKIISRNWFLIAIATCAILGIHGVVLFLKGVDPKIILVVTIFSLIGYVFLRFLIPAMIRFISIANSKKYDSLSGFVNAGLIFFSLGYIGYSIFEIMVLPFLGEISTQSYFSTVPIAFGAVDGLFNARKKNESM